MGGCESAERVEGAPMAEGPPAQAGLVDVLAAAAGSRHEQLQLVAADAPERIQAYDGCEYQHRYYSPGEPRKVPWPIWPGPLELAISNGDATAARILRAAGAEPSEALVRAAGNGALPAVLAILEAGGGVEATSVALGHTPLTAACWGGRGEVVEALLAAKAAVDRPSGADTVGGSVTALVAAAGMGHTRVVGLLLAASAEVDLAVGARTALSEASRTGVITVITQLLGAGASVNGSSGAGTSPLVAASGHSGACSQARLQVVQELIRLEADVNRADGANLTPLGAAVLHSHQPIVNELLASRADPNPAGVEYPPLHVAVEAGQLALVRALLAARARVDLPGVCGVTALELAMLSGRADSTQARSHYLKIRGQGDLKDSAIVDELLSADADVGQPWVNAISREGCSPLVATVAQGQLFRVRALLSVHADPNLAAVDPSCTMHRGIVRSPLCVALSGQLYQNIEQASGILDGLIEAKADCNCVDGSSGLPLLHLLVADAELCSRFPRQAASFVKRLLDAAAQVDSVNGQGWTPLLVACGAGWAGGGDGYVGIVQMLLAATADANRDDNSAQHITPLLYAVRQSQSDRMVQSLLAAKASADVPSAFTPKNGELPLMAVAVGLWPGQLSSSTLTALVSANASVNAASREDGRTALHHNVSADQVRWLLQAKADANLTSLDGATPLISAAFSREATSASLEMLLSAGASVEVADDRGDTALGLAALNGDGDKALVLLDAGADANKANLTGETPLWLASTRSSRWNHHREQRYASTIQVLLAFDAQVNQPDGRGTTPLWQAAARGGSITTQVLLNSGAELEAPDLHGHTALVAAGIHERAPTVRVLLAAKANLNRVDKNGNTPLLWAVAADPKRVEVVSTLIGAKADVDATNVDGDTALVIALNLGHTELIDVLQDPTIQLN